MSLTNESTTGGMAQQGHATGMAGQASVISSILPTPLIDAEKVQAKTAEVRREARAVRHEARVAAKAAMREHKGKLRESSKTRKSAATKERIMEAASALITERRGVDFQMSEVAERCDMSKGALYYYFSDRDDLVEAIFNRGIDEFVERLENVVTDARSSKEALLGLCQEFSESVRTGGPVVFAMSTQIISGPGKVLPAIESRLVRVSRIIEVQLERAKGENLVRGDLDSAFAASSICGSFFFAAIEAWGASGGDALDGDAFTNNLIDLTMRGIGTAGA